MSNLKWSNIWSKVRIIVLVLVLAAVNGVVDALTAYDWGAVGGSYGALIGVAVAAIAAWWKRENVGGGTGV